MRLLDDLHFVARLGEVNQQRHAVPVGQLARRFERGAVERVRRMRSDRRSDERVGLPLRDERLGPREPVGRRRRVGDRKHDHRLPEDRPQAGLVRGLGDVVFEVVHVGERGRARLDHLERREPRPHPDELWRHGRLLRREDVLLEPVHQREVVGEAPVEHHRHVRVGVDETGQHDLAGRVDPAARRKLAAKLLQGANGHDAIAVDRDGAVRNHASRGVHRHDRSARHHEVHAPAALASDGHRRQQHHGRQTRANPERSRRSHRPDSIAYVYSLNVPVHLVEHPVAQDALISLRDRATGASRFRRLTHRLSLIVATEATRKLPMSLARVETPLEPANGEALEADIVVVPVLRAGLGMVDAVLELLPHARVGHIGLQRDEHTAVAARYYAKLPADLSNSVSLVVDPMLATGGSAVSAISLLQQAGARDIRLLCIVAAPEGIAAVEKVHPAVHIFTPAIDRELNAQKFILPGLGDFGDRLYGTA